MCEFRILDGVHEPLCLIDVRGRDGKRHGVAWKRVETEDGASDNAELEADLGRGDDER